MIDKNTEYYMNLLQLQILLIEIIRKRKNKKKEFKSWEKMLDDLTYIVDFHERNM